MTTPAATTRRRTHAAATPTPATPADVVKRETARAKREHWELALLAQLRALHLPEPEQQVLFHPTRRYRADFCYRPERLLIEVQGGVWVSGRHNRASGYEADCRRTCEAMKHGWRILPVTPAMIASGEAVTYVEAALQAIWQQKRNANTRKAG